MMENMNYAIYDSEKQLKIKYALYTSAGDRSENEDYMLIASDYNGMYFSLADGLSRYGGGKRAAQAACKSAIGDFASNTINDFDYHNVFAKIYKNASEKIKQVQSDFSNFNKMYSTLNLLYINPTNAYLSHIGNTRTYLFRNGKKIVRTNDHSQEAALERAGIIPDDEKIRRRNRKIILKALGDDADGNNFELSEPIKVEAGDDFLICSDGLWEYIEDAEIEKALSNSSKPCVWLNNMLEYIGDKEIKNKDNLSAIAIHIDGIEINDGK